jgi:hypothetical protein
MPRACPHARAGTHRSGIGARAAGVHGPGLKIALSGEVRIRTTNPQGRIRVIILGLILLILGFALGINILWTIGIILLVVGAVLYLLGATGRAVGGRNHWY